MQEVLSPFPVRHTSTVINPQTREYIDWRWSISSSRSVLMSRDWLAGRWAPARCQLGTLTRAGYAFPPGTPLRASKTKRMRPEQRFVREQFPGFQPGRWVGEHFIPIPWPEVSAMQG